MQGTLQPIRQMLNGANQYLIPAYQRDYQWNSERWQALISDVVGAATAAETDPKHWLGIFLISENSQMAFPGVQMGPANFTVIDGQQRLVTLTLWLAALIHESNDRNPDGDQLNLDSIARVKVQDADRIAYEIAMSGSWRNGNNFELLSQHQILKAYSYFRHIIWLGQEAVSSEEPIKIKLPKIKDQEKSFQEQLKAFLATKAAKDVPQGAQTNVDQLLEATLNGLQIYTLIHQPAQDESQTVIFDTLNGMRQELEPLDHVRNSLFVKIADVEGRAVYKDYWYPAETGLRKIKVKSLGAARSFIYDFVISQGEKKRQGTIKSGKGAVHFSHIVRDFNESQLITYLQETFVPAMAIYPVVTRFKDTYTFLGQTHNIPASIHQRLDTIRDLNQGPTNPLVLLFMTALITNRITEPNLIKALDLIERYVVRQILADKPMSPLRSKVMEVCGSIDKSLDLIELEKALFNSADVADGEILAIAKTKQYNDLNAKSQGAILRSIERQLSGAGSMWFQIGKTDPHYSIEHVYPQTPNKWLENLASWGVHRPDMDALLETIGNLTAVTKSHNSSVGNKTFAEKKAFPTREGHGAPLKINELWIDPAVLIWGPDQIKARSQQLIEKAINHWPRLRDLP
jgi:hypothetical protein